MVSCLFACFGSSKCCSSSHISPARQHPGQESIRCEQQTTQMNPEPHQSRVLCFSVVREDELVEKKVAFDLNVTSDVQLDILLPQKDDEEKEAHYTACCDDDKFDFEESSESLFSLSIDSRKKKHHGSAETEEVTSSRSRTPFSFSTSGLTMTNGNSSELNQSVLKPMENLAGWKTPLVTRRADGEDKENMSSLEQQRSLLREAAAVDDTTSLSSWLVNSNSSSIKSAGNNKEKKNKRRDDETTSTVASYLLHIEQASATSDYGSSSKKQQQTNKEMECR